MEEIYNSHPYWINRDQSQDEGKLIQRALIAQLLSLDDISDWKPLEEWKSLKTRLDSVIDMLREVGCFILKKGTIECYYQYSSGAASNRKTNIAVEEVEALSAFSNDAICEVYQDVVFALEDASATRLISENHAVEKELLSELALVLEIVPQIREEKEIYATLKQHKGNTLSIFKYAIIREGDKLGVEVSLDSAIIDVAGFPFEIFVGDNVNSVVKRVVSGGT